MYEGTIYIASDHAGFTLKSKLKETLSHNSYVTLKDLGTHNTYAVDYPVYAKKIAEALLFDSESIGILLCGTGIGMSMAINRYIHIRGALCHTPYEATTARQHNHANVLILGGRILSVEQAELCAKAFIENDYEWGRHERRVNFFSYTPQDKEIARLLIDENNRQRNTIDLIASENIIPKEIMHATGSVLTNKYAEGYPKHRYYGGCEVVDKIESLGMQRLKKLFNAQYVNIQPHSGSSANIAVYSMLLEQGDTFMGLSLDSGGHLTHGSPVNFSGKQYHAVPYHLNKTTNLLDYNEILTQAKQVKPKMIIAGFSAYPRMVDFKAFREICDEVGAYLFVDMAHIAGLISAGFHPNPLPYAHIVSTTVHKTLRGARGGALLTNDPSMAKKMNKMIFPGLQGGPIMNEIAGKTIAFYLANTETFHAYSKQIIQNAKAMEITFKERNIPMISGGTDTHLLLLDLHNQGIKGNELEEAVMQVNIITNKNMIPYDAESPFVTSGLRIGTPSITSRGMKERESAIIANYIADIIDSLKNKAQHYEIMQKSIRKGVQELCELYPIYKGLL